MRAGDNKLKDIKDLWTGRVLSVLENMADTAGIDSKGFSRRLKVGKPPESAMGDLSYPLFPFAKDFKKAPPALAGEIAGALGGGEAGVSVAGPYLNIRIDRAAAISRLLANIESSGDKWGFGDELAGRKVMVEFSSPNTNKPLHLGHLRNDILGESGKRSGCAYLQVHAGLSEVR